MMVPIRAIYKRRQRGEPDGPPEMINAAYADVPDALLMGMQAQTILDRARAAGDEGAVEVIGSAVDRATADGKLMTM